MNQNGAPSTREQSVASDAIDAAPSHHLHLAEVDVDEAGIRTHLLLGLRRPPLMWRWCPRPAAAPRHDVRLQPARDAKTACIHPCEASGMA